MGMSACAVVSWARRCVYETGTGEQGVGQGIMRCDRATGGGTGNQGVGQGSRGRDRGAGREDREAGRGTGKQEE